MNEELKVAIKTARIECKNVYALTYLKAIDTAIEQYGEEGLKVQLLYCLSNMQSWRGSVARDVKKVFKKYSK